MSEEMIDWSKAPEGATRYHPETSKIIAHWLKMVGDEEWIWTSAGKRWMPHIDPVEGGEYYERPAPTWSGEGLPPVGILCKLAGESGDLKPLHPEWEGREVKVYAHFTSDRGVNMAAYVSPDHMIGGCGISAMFKPIKTPEQIAAEEREKAAKQICVDAGSPELTAGQMAIAYRLYDAGYRKVDPAGAQP